MGHHLGSILLALWLSVGLGGAAAAQSRDAVDARIETLLGGAASFSVAFEVLQEAVAAGDRETVASLVVYPIRVRIDGRPVVLRSERAMRARYDAVFTPDVAAAVTGQDYAELFVNFEGVMFGNGEVWMAPYCTDRTCAITYWLVRAINIP